MYFPLHSNFANILSKVNKEIPYLHFIQNQIVAANFKESILGICKAAERNHTIEN